MSRYNRIKVIAADFVIGSNDEDGVGKAIQQYILR